MDILYRNVNIPDIITSNHNNDLIDILLSKNDNFIDNIRYNSHQNIKYGGFTNYEGDDNFENIYKYVNFHKRSMFMFNNSNVIIDKFNDFIDYIIKNRQNNTDYNILVIDYRKKTDIYCMSIRFETIQNLFSKEDMVHIHSISVRDIHFIERLDISKRPGE